MYINNNICMNNNIKKLPIDIVNYIISYTYSPQSKELTNDIKSYFKTKKKVFTYYHNMWFDNMYEDSDKIWLINDLFSFANDYNPTIFSYVDSFYTIFSRNFMLKSDYNKIKMYISNLENEKIDKQINIFWGILTPDERKDFIDIANMKIRIFN